MSTAHEHEIISELFSQLTTRLLSKGASIALQPNANVIMVTWPHIMRARIYHNVESNKHVINICISSIICIDPSIIRGTREIQFDMYSNFMGDLLIVITKIWDLDKWYGKVKDKLSDRLDSITAPKDDNFIRIF